MTKPLTPAEKQKRYRDRQNARRNEDAGLASAARSLCYWIERAREKGVSNVTLTLGPIPKQSDFHAEITRIEAQIAGATVEAKKQKTGAGNTATNGTHAPGSPVPLQSKVKPKRAQVTRRKAVTA